MIICGPCAKSCQTPILRACLYSRSRCRARGCTPLCAAQTIAHFSSHSRRPASVFGTSTQRFVVGRCSAESGAAVEATEAAPAQVLELVGEPETTSTHAVQTSIYQPASLSRAFIGVQPGRGAARLTRGVGKPSGPMSMILLLFTVAGTISAAVRSRFEAAARECYSCHGYGINRCTLCQGSGGVGFEAKWNHTEPCPMCLGKRFVNCNECGGHFHRRIFTHKHQAGTSVTDMMEAELSPVGKLSD